MDLRPTRFTGFTATLTLTGFVGICKFAVDGLGCSLPIMKVILLPVLLVVLRQRAKSTLICLTFFFVLCQRKVPNSVLFTKVYTIICFMIKVHFNGRLVTSSYASVNRFSILLLVIVLSTLLIGDCYGGTSMI